MKTKTYIILLVLSATMSSWAQLSINDYKYISVPDKFDFLKSKDQYQLNSLTVFLLQKQRFTVLDKSENYPMDLAQNNCLLLNANVIKLKGFLTTKLQLELTNCKNRVVFSSEVGTSKFKEYKRAYHEALRDAFASSEFNYAYSGINNMDVVPEPPKTDASSTPVSVTELAVEKEEPQKVEASVLADEVVSGLLIQQTNSGYDFIDVVSKTIKFSTHATLFDNVYIIDGQEGIIYKRGQNWVREYIENGNTTIEAFNIQY